MFPLLRPSTGKKRAALFGIGKLVSTLHFRCLCLVAFFVTAATASTITFALCSQLRPSSARNLKMATSEQGNGQNRKKEDILAPLVGKAREFKIKQEPAPGQVFQSGVGVAVFVTNPKYPGAILLGKRKGSAGAGTWALPGGHLDFGESFEECAQRETREETALSLSNLRVSTVNNAIDLEARYHYVVIFVRGETSEEPTNTEPDKCEGWQWVTWKSTDFPAPLFTALQNVRAAGFDPFAD